MAERRRVSKAADVAEKLVREAGGSETARRRVSKAGEVVEKIARESSDWDRSTRPQRVAMRDSGSGRRRISKAEEVVEKIARETSSSRPQRVSDPRPFRVPDSSPQQKRPVKLPNISPFSAGCGSGCCALPFLAMVLGAIASLIAIF